MKLPSARFQHTPNFSDRGGNKPVAIIIHYTAAGSTDGTARWFSSSASKVSAHFLIGRDGELIQFVDTDHAAWHAGAGRFAMGQDIYSQPNRFTIGIELANHGLIYKSRTDYFYEIGGTSHPYKQQATPVWGSMRFPNGHNVEGYFEPYPEAQLLALKDVLAAIAQRGGPTQLFGHDEIAAPMGRKIDPGCCFPWPDFGRKDRPIQSYINDVRVS